MTETRAINEGQILIGPPSRKAKVVESLRTSNEESDDGV